MKNRGEKRDKMSRVRVKNEVRDSFLERIRKPGCSSIGTIAEEMHLPKATLYSWIAAAKQRERRGVSMNKKTAERSPLNKLNLIAKSEGLGLEDMKKFCEEKGVSLTELHCWRDLALSAMEHSGNGNVISEKQHKEETASLRAELNRKEKALAEAAALLILQKKLRNSWARENSLGQETGNPCSHRGSRPKWRKEIQRLFRHRSLRTPLQALAQMRRRQARRHPFKNPGPFGQGTR